jgi:hypothetical protein
MDKVPRQTRSLTHNPFNVVLHLDEDNALINSSKDNKSSNMSTSGSNSEH